MHVTNVTSVTSPAPLNTGCSPCWLRSQSWWEPPPDPEQAWQVNIVTETDQDDNGVDQMVLHTVPPRSEGSLCGVQLEEGEEGGSEGCHGFLVGSYFTDH